MRSAATLPTTRTAQSRLPYQFPLPAKDSMDYTQAPVGFRLELFASEPDIINPIGLAWDERGRLWVAETVDYPERDDAPTARATTRSRSSKTPTATASATR